MQRPASRLVFKVRLQNLKDLYDKKLITKDDYDKKRKEIVNTL